MLGGWLKARRRRRVLDREAIDEPLWAGTVAAVPALSTLDAQQRERLRELVLLLMHEKRFDGAGGLVLSEAMRIRIAALAAVPILELGIDAYAGFRTIVVHPAEFIARGREEIDEAGVVHIGDEVMSGEAWEAGPIVLAWEEVQASGQGDGFDVVAHELAHKLDMLDGAVNGMPPLHRGMPSSEWTSAFQQAYDRLLAEVDRGNEPWLDPYAAENPGEFFAVCSEMFFDVPLELRAHYPAVYEQLRRFYRQDPAVRFASAARS